MGIVNKNNLFYAHVYLGQKDSVKVTIDSMPSALEQAHIAERFLKTFHFSKPSSEDRDFLWGHLEDYNRAKILTKFKHYGIETNFVMENAERAVLDRTAVRQRGRSLFVNTGFESRYVAEIQNNGKPLRLFCTTEKERDLIVNWLRYFTGLAAEAPNEEPPDVFFEKIRGVDSPFIKSNIDERFPGLLEPHTWTSEFDSRVFCKCKGRLLSWEESHLKGLTYSERFKNEIKRGTFEFLDNPQLIWVTNLGYVPCDRWMDFVSEEFLQFKRSWSDEFESLSGSRGDRDVLMQEESFLVHIQSDQYRSFIYRFSSKAEEATSKVLQSSGIKHIKSFREFKNPTTGRPFELDLFLPGLNVAFEFNGYYWHSSAHCDRDYHAMKTEVCLHNGVRLYHVWEMDEDKMIQLVLNKVGLNKKIHARKLEVRRIPHKESATFFEQHHAEGASLSFLSLGLFNEDECLASMSFRRHPEGVEIARFASKSGITIVGGFSKLLKQALPILKAKGYKTLISYCNRDLTPDHEDSVYHKQGFQFLGDSGPILKYLCNTEHEDLGLKSQTIYARQRFQKHLLREMFPNAYSDEKTEKQILEENKIYQVWNSGNWKFRLNF